jgi:hypothetical protein
MLTAIQPQARWRPPPPPSSQRLHLHQITVSCSAESAASKSTNQKSDSNERNSSADEEDANGYRSRRPQQQGRDSSGQRPDTRIHWGTSTEGWIGLEDSALPSSSSSSSAPSGGGGDDEDGGRNSSSGRRRPGVTDSLRGLLAAAPDSHYGYLGVSADAELEEIKAAYRRLSKEYHPDSTSLPLEVAAEKFLRLKKAYDVLSSEEERRLYDWQLAQMYSSVQGGRFIWPYEADRTQRGYGSRPPPTVRQEPVNADTLGGRNMPLSGQAQTALAFDVFALFVSLLAILYASFFKHPPGQ